MLPVDATFVLSWLRRRPTWHPRLTPERLAAALMLAVIVMAIAPTSSGGATYQVPNAIAADCSVDVTQSLRTWIASVPNDATLVFGSGRCYRIEGTLEIRGRSGLTFDGSGATFRSFNPPADQRALWRVVDSTNFALRNMTLQGSYTRGGTFTYDLQHAHAIDLRGTGAELANLKMSDFAGDCVYFGLGYSSALNRSSGSLHDSSCLGTGRNGVAVSAGNDIRVERNTLDRIGFTVFDVEPNIGPGWGAQRVTFDNNTIRAYYLYAYAIVENAPITDQAFTNNRVLGRGLRIGIVHPGASYRPANITISGNSSDTAQWSPAMEMQKVDGLIVTNNTVPMSGGAMAWVEESCAVNLAGNSYPGGSSQVKMSPWVCSLSPASGPVGTIAKIAGSGYTGASAVAFNGVRASFTVNSDAQITAAVPSGATSGPVSVTTAGGTAKSSSNFTVTAAAAAPVIGSFTPTSGLVGTGVTVSGSGFTGATAVSVNGSAAPFTVNSGSQITLTVPSGATSGPIRVTTPAGTATSPASFTVTAAAAAPVIGSFTPTSGLVGTGVTVSGSGFTGATAVSVNGSAAPFTVNSGSQITLTVPSGATSGPVSVTTAGGTAKSPATSRSQRRPRRL